MKLVELLREIGNSHGVTPGVVAVAWTLHHPAITAAIVGGRSAQQVEQMTPALEFRLSDEEYARINTFLESNQELNLRSRIENKNPDWRRGFY